MSTAARIEELRKKFDENPRRYFAPLANELRKAGELKQAIALCREHLPKQPGHMSGYIVFGQALFEVGDLDEARTVFEQALALDPENLIALHHLGHIARQQGDTPAARRWYERALETDPRNDGIAHQLAALATPVRSQPAIPTPVSSAAVDPDRELAFLEAGIIAPRRDLGAIPTPPAAQEAIGALPLAPTPDAAMRAVDFDVVNAYLSNSHDASIGTPTVPNANEPIDLGFDAPSANDGQLPQTNHESDVTPESEPLAGDPAIAEPAIAESAVAESAVAESAAAESAAAGPARPALGDDPFVFADDELAAVSLTSATAPVDLDAAFEEGLVTAGWPDPTDLAAVATPRTVTPASIEVTADAAEAFGREAGDPVDLPLPEPEVEVLGDEADLAAPALQSVAAIDQVDEAVTGTDSEAELPWLAAPVTPTEDVSAIMHALEADARALGEPDDVSVFALPTPPAEEQMAPGLLADEASFSDVLPPIDAVEAAAEPLLAEPLLNVMSEPQHELAAGIDALATDPGTAEEASLPADGGDHDFEADASDFAEAAATQPPAFVTETMGELLVAQGFVDRAVAVYEELVRRRPYDPLLSARLAELREQLETTAPVSVYTARERFASLAARRVLRRTPVRPYTPVSASAVTPKSATAISATPIAVAPVTSSPALSPALDAALTRHSATPHVPPAIVAEESLAALFGTESRGNDDFAAQSLADAFAPLPLDSAPAEGFTTTFLGAPDVPRTPTPAYGAVRQPTPMSVPPVTPAGTDAGQEFSFDRFFPDPASQAGAASAGGAAGGAAAPSDQTAAGEPSPGEDLAQFSAWLKGLGQS